MPDIKKRESHKGTIKIVDKSAIASERMRDTFIRTKEKAENGYYQDSSHDTPEEYASDQATDKAESAARYTISAANRFGKNATRKTIRSIKEHRAKKAAQNPTSTELSIQPNPACSTGAPYTRSATSAPKQLAEKSGQAVKTTNKTIKQTAKGTIKTTQKSVKTAVRTEKAAIKTTQQTAKAAEKTAKASVKAAQKAAQAARAAAKATVATVKAAVKATIAAVKAIVAGTKALIAAIAAGGWVAVVVIIVICLIALIVGSCFGIFFSNEATPGGTPMTQVVAQLNTEYYDKIEQIKAGNNYDDVEVISSDGVQAVKWNEVLAVYAVKVTTDGNGTDVVTITDDKIAILRQVLWDMNNITHSSKTVSKEVDVTETGADGKETIVKKTVSEKILTINLTHKSYSEMISAYSFNADQTEQLQLLMSHEYTSMWAELLGGYCAGTDEIILSGADWKPTDIFSWALPESFSISSQFGYRSDPFTGETKFHGGLDIAAPAGTPILAAADGTVEVANATDNWGYGYGYHVKIRHNDTYQTLYAHCSSIAVVNGQEVKKGQVIAYVGTTGNSTGNHLHFEVYKDGERSNPLNYFK